MRDPGAFAERHIAVRNEPDEEQHREAIAEPWAAEGRYLDPLNDVRITGRSRKW